MREWARIHRSDCIAVDATYSVGRDLSGVGVYSREILFGTASAHPDRRFVWAYRPHRFLRSWRDRLPRNASRAVLTSGGTIGRSCGVYHSLNQRVDRHFAPTVATFHDLFVLTGEYSTPDFRARFAAQARRAAENSDLIIAVSSFTAAQVIGLLGYDRNRVRVIHHGVHPPDTPPPLDSQRENLVLHVGAVQSRKNIGRLVRAFERMPAGWRMVLAGGAGYGAESILQQITASPRSADIVVAGYLSVAALEALYRRARIFAFPSLDEGFGMPVLEAMSRGVPVLTSNRSALPEVAGDAAILVNPEDADAISTGLCELANETGLRMNLARRGLQRAALFPWSRAVEATWTVYGEVTR